MRHEGRSPPIVDFINGIGQKRKGSQRAYSVRIGSKDGVIGRRLVSCAGDGTGNGCNRRPRCRHALKPRRIGRAGGKVGLDVFFTPVGRKRQGDQSLIACGGSKTVGIAVQTPPADCPCRNAGTVCVEINSISADGTRGVAVAIFVCGYALVADCPCGPAVAVAISAHVLTADPACRIAVPISVGVYGAIAVSACRKTTSIRVKAAALGVQRKNGYRQH